MTTEEQTIELKEARVILEEITKKRELADDAMRLVFEGRQDISALEREGAESLVLEFANDLDEARSPNLSEDDYHAVLKVLAGTLADNELLRKLLAGYEVEWLVFNDGRVDGLVGSEVDRVIETLRPYWERKLK